MRTNPALLCGAALLLAVPAPQGVLQRDKTGIEWAFPFEKARAQAQQEKRLLLIKPVAFGTSPDGGW